MIAIRKPTVQRPFRFHVKRATKKLVWRVRRPTAPWRALPDFIVIGAQKSGTTSLFRYIMSHPAVARPFGQEPVFFSHERNYAQGVERYRTEFPLSAAMNRQGVSRITGEASGEYLYYPAAPARIRGVLPDVKLVCVVRDPVERTLSHYRHNVRLGLDTVSLEQAIERELEWHKEAASFVEPWGGREFGVWGNHLAYLGRSMYAHHLARWVDTFQTERILLVRAEALHDEIESRAATAEVLDFLGLDPLQRAYPRANRGSSANLDPRMAELLESLMAEWDDRLTCLRTEMGLCSVGWP